MIASTRRALPWLLACSLLVALPAQAQRLPWNQADVTRIAKDLSSALKRLQQSVEREPEQHAVIGERKRQAAIVEVRRLNALTDDLVVRLARGDGRAETQPVYQEIQSTRREAREQARDVLSPTETQKSIAKARGLLERLASYYEETPRS
jgi:hypothetical protein